MISGFMPGRNGGVRLHRDEEVARQLRVWATRGALPHALILSGEGDRLAAARLAAAGFQCTAEGERPCLACPACRKVLAGIHPDVSVIRDDEHRCLPLETLRGVRSDAYVIPNEGRRKVYIFDDCARLDAAGQDVLLKVVEEGPPYAAFLFLAENSAALLPTLRSRCAELRLADEPAQTESDPRAEELCALAAKRDGRGAAALLLGLSAGRMKREEVSALLRESRALFGRALLLRAGAAEEGPACVRAAAALPAGTLMRITEILGRLDAACDYNAGAGHLLGALAAELEEILS